jgi:hypothetical protein
VFRKTDGKWSVRFKQYLRDENGKMRLGKPISILTGPFNQDGTQELREIFGDLPFNNPKPKQLVKYLLSMIVNDKDENNYIALDSFCGSGTTAHAVLELNHEDGGNRRFITIEMDADTCQNIAACRLVKAVSGYTRQTRESGPVEGLGGGFRFCKLSHPIFDENGQINGEVRFADLAAHVFFTETGEPIPKRPNGKNPSPLIGVCNGTAYYLLFNGVLGDKRPNGGNVLTSRILAELPGFAGKPLRPGEPAHAGPKVIYGEGSRLGAARLKREGVTFKQVPYEIKVS